MDPGAVDYAAADHVQALAGILGDQLPDALFHFFHIPKLVVRLGEEVLLHNTAVIRAGLCGEDFAALLVDDEIRVTGYDCACLFDCHMKHSFALSASIQIYAERKGRTFFSVIAKPWVRL